jgi:hypothetical protein
MVKKYTKNTLQNVYKDDYDADKGFHKILFNSGKSLQARELTQIQTIIESGIERFGRNIFKEGAAVTPGGITVNRRYSFVKLDTSVNGLPAVPNVLVGRSLTGQTSGVIVKVLQVVEANLASGDPATVYVRYTSTVNGVSGETPVRITPGETLLEIDGSISLITQSINTVANPSHGYATRISIGSSDYFVLGKFVHAPSQSIILSKYSDTFNGDVGFRVSEEIVSATDDNSLYDNQGALPNYTAPGADRLRITLELISKSDLLDGETFVYYAKIVNSLIVDEVTGFNQYNKINDLLAVRTKEESGDYTVLPFKAGYETATDATKLTVKISTGSAYVNGYRIVKKVPSFLTVDKPTTTGSLVNEPSVADYGYYVIVENLIGLPTLAGLPAVELRTPTVFGPTGSLVATARIRGIEQYLTGYKLYLFELKTENGQTFKGDAKSIGNSNFSGTLKLEQGLPVIKESKNKSLLFAIPKPSAKALSNISVTFQKSYSGTLTLATNSISLTSASGETFSNTSEWLFALADGTIISDTSNLTFSGIGTSSIQVSGASLTGTDGDSIQAIAYTFKSQATVATKVLKTTNRTIDVISGAVDLDHPDIYEVTSIRYANSTGNDATSVFILDKGQRETHYENGKLIVRPGKTPASTTIYIEYSYFAHGSGDFFSVNSYTNLAYNDIPSATLDDGTIVDLKGVYDFRSTKNDSYEFSGAGSIVKAIPKNLSVISADIEYYLPRYDKILLNENGNFSVLQGNPSFNPKFPITPENNLELYRVKMNPNSKDENDLSIKVVENKRYTMRDIGKIEKRIDNLEEVTSLNLLELDTKNIDVLDTSGRNRTKSGFFADNFVDQYHTDVKSPEYSASIDPKDRTARPSYRSRNIGLTYNDTSSTGVVLRGDNIYLDYTNEEYISQPEVTSTISVNPYIILDFEGHITLSPASDEWKETEYTAQNIIDNGTILDASQAILWDEWEWNWAGSDLNGIEVGATLSQTQLVGSSGFNNAQTSGRTTTTTMGRVETSRTVVNRVIGSETIREVVGDRVVDVALIPFMRSRLVYFRAEGLQPNASVFPYFDGIAISEWCRQEAFVGINENKRKEWGNTQINAVNHPNGTTELYTDGRGSVEGSFFIPSTGQLRFRTGTTEFKILDVSVNIEENSVSVGRSLYTSSGLLYNRTEDVLSTRVLEISGSERIDTNRIVTGRTSVTTEVERDRGPDEFGGDPLAQTFEVGEPDGVFITKASLYFSAKAEILPVWVQIRPMVNGYPSSSDIVPGSFKLLSPSQVSVSNDASLTTDFIFDEPVYLNSYTEYALVILANDPDYFVYRAKLGEFSLGTTEVRFGRQSYLGSLFKGQNGATWTASQEEDLKFDLHRAEFSAGGTAILDNTDLPNRILSIDPIELFWNSASTSLAKVSHIGHGFISGDAVDITGVDSSSDFGGILNGTHTVIDVDPSGYTFDATGVSIPSPLVPALVGGITTEVNENYQFNVNFPIIEDLIPNNTNTLYTGRFHSGKSFAGTETPFVRDGADVEVKPKENNYYEFPKIIAGGRQVGAQNTLSVNASAQITANMSTTNSYVSPVIDLQRASMVLVENIIDNPGSTATSINNVPIEFVAETENSGGSAASKHITRPMKLINSSRGMRIFLGANRPSVSGIEMYYRTSIDDSPLKNVNWTYIEPENAVPSDDDPSIFREYIYTPGGDDGDLDDFNTLQLKVVFTSTNSSKVPVLRDLRVIALGD